MVAPLLIGAAMWSLTIIRSSSYLPVPRTRRFNGNQRKTSSWLSREIGLTIRSGCRTSTSDASRLFHATSQSITDFDDNARHYVFGYGSLICPLSRQITNQNLMDKFTIPISIHHLERQWCARTSTGYTAMGVQFTATTGRFCTGILIGTIDSDELQDLDQREASYNRLPVPLDTISAVPFVDPNACSISDNSSWYNNDEHHAITSILSSNSHRWKENWTSEIVVGSKDDVKDDCTTSNINVWVYVPKNPIPPDTSHPILQSYIDIILRGCLNTIGETFARSFISTTTGWSRNSNCTNNASIQHYWVNDRDFPIYKRADRIYSVLNAAKIDQVLFEELYTIRNSDSNRDSVCQTSNNMIPTIRRHLYDPVLHLEQLVHNVEVDCDSVHPLAFQHFVSRIRNYGTSQTSDG